MLTIATLVSITLACVIASPAKIPRKATWNDFEGAWIGYDTGTGAFFYRISLTTNETGTCVVLPSDDEAWLYKVTVTSWDDQWNITLRFESIPNSGEKQFEMARVDGVGLTLRETNVRKPDRPREVQLVRESDMKQNIARAEDLAEKLK